MPLHCEWRSCMLHTLAWCCYGLSSRVCWLCRLPPAMRPRQASRRATRSSTRAHSLATSFGRPTSWALPTAPSMRARRLSRLCTSRFTHSTRLSFVHILLALLRLSKSRHAWHSACCCVCQPGDNLQRSLPAGFASRGPWAAAQGENTEVNVKRLPKKPTPPRFGRKLTAQQRERATHICLDCGYIYCDQCDHPSHARCQHTT